METRLLGDRARIPSARGKLPHADVAAALGISSGIPVTARVVIQYHEFLKVCREIERKHVSGIKAPHIDRPRFWYVVTLHLSQSHPAFYRPESTCGGREAHGAWNSASQLQVELNGFDHNAFQSAGSWANEPRHHGHRHHGRCHGLARQSQDGRRHRPVLRA